MKQFVMLLLILSLNVHARDLGKRGVDFEIAEKSMLSLIEDRLRTLDSSGEMDVLKTDFIKRVKKHINRPNALNLPKALITKSHPYYPVVKVERDIFDKEGHVIARRGTSINALKNMPGYFPYWVFINGDDKTQVSWAKVQLTKHFNTKIILTGGSIKTVSNQLGARIYFDQEGRITQKLGITHVPAIVERKGDALLITEKKIAGESDA
jgi:conjugal transfer pilus assembly protein TraW